MNAHTPQLWVFAGPNGAGKSTLVSRHGVADRLPVVNPDNIAQQISPGHHGETSVMIQAGRIALAERQRLLAERRSFAFETTLTGRGELALMTEAKRQGYKVNLVFVGVRGVEHSRSRVALRVREGGHPVPVADILRRFDRSQKNLAPAIRLSDRAYVLDNSRSRPRLILKIEQGQTKTISRNVPEWAKKAIPADLLSPPRRGIGHDL